MKDEINFRELLGILYKGKWTIIIVVVIAVAFSGVVNFFYLPPKYETVARLDIRQLTGDKNIKVDLYSIRDSLKEDAFVNKLIEELKLDTSEHTISSILNYRADVDLSNNQVIRVTASGENPEFISMIANYVIYQVGAKAETARLNQTSLDSRKEIDSLEDEIRIAEDKFNETQLLLTQIPEKQITRRTIADDTLLLSIMNEQTQDAVKLQVESENVNPAYVELQTEASKIRLEITSLEAKKDNLNSRIDTNNQRIAELNQNQMPNVVNYSAFADLIKDNDEVNIQLAPLPDSPVGPNKERNIIISGFLAGALAALFVMYRHYWKS